MDELVVFTDDGEKKPDFSHLRDQIDKLTQQVGIMVAVEEERSTISGRIRVRSKDLSRDLAEFAHKLWRERRRREPIFGSQVLGEPGWDILLYLYARGQGGKPTITKQVCSCSGAPASTALRWLELLEREGLISRAGDAVDRRRQIVTITEAGSEKMANFLGQALGIATQLSPETIQQT